MIKNIFFIAIISFFSTGFSQKALQNPPILHEEEEYLNLTLKENGNYKVSSLNDNSLLEYRIYSEYVDDSENIKNVDEISVGVFVDVINKPVLMISNGIQIISDDLFLSPISKIYFTGSSQEWSQYNLNTNIDVFFYQFDEGFINYWNTKVRPEASSDVCDINQDGYIELSNLYNSLLARDKQVVDNYVDSSGMDISTTMSYLKKYFDNLSQKDSENVSHLSQDTTIGLIVSIAIFGMTTISIFYVLKRQNIIE